MPNATRARPARRDLPGLPAAVPPDLDDDDGRPARGRAPHARHRHGFRAPPSAGHHNRGRPDCEPDADPVHHPGHLSRPGSRCGPPPRAARGRRSRSNPARLCHEFFRDLRPPARGHDAAHLGHRAGRHRRVFSAAGRAAAPAGHSRHRGECRDVGRQPGDDGEQRGKSAGAPSGRDSGRHRDGLHEQRRRNEHLPSIRVRSEHRRSGAGCPGRDNRGAHRPAGGDPRQPDL